MTSLMTDPLRDPNLSVAPDGSIFAIPSRDEQTRAFSGICKMAQASANRGQQVVAIQGLGFVGCAVAAVVANAKTSCGEPKYFAIGVDRDTPAAYWKIAKIKEGKTPIESPDKRLGDLIGVAVRQDRTLVATSDDNAYGLADIILIDLPLDVVDRSETSTSAIDIRLEPFKAALRSVAKHMREDALVIIETTVPIGLCEKVIVPLFDEERQKRGFSRPVRLGHAYERVMPGPRYVESIDGLPRTYSGIDAESRQSTRTFLESIMPTAADKLFELPSPTASEMAKILENSYRAMNIAFIHEWTLLAEASGVNLFDVVDSIRVRKGTHDNMRYPGFGVGGYCLTKDSLLAQWSASNLLHSAVELKLTLEALRVNHSMPLHAFSLMKDLLGPTPSSFSTVLAGVSYLPEVADSRNSPTEILFDALDREQWPCSVTDPYLARWEERPNALYEQDFAKAVGDAECIVFTIGHKSYKELSADELLSQAPRLRAVVDGFNVLGDEIAKDLHRRGIRILGVGKGHWRKEGLQK